MQKEVSPSEEYDVFEPIYNDAQPNEASYFEKSQSYNPIITKMRRDYLGYVAKEVKDTKGNWHVQWKIDPDKQLGINKIGVNEVIQFLEDRLNKHTLLTNWTEDRMFIVIKDDMDTWIQSVIRNWDRWEVSPATAEVLRSTINDFLETAYRRGIEDKERKSMTPGVSMLHKLGIIKQDPYSRDELMQSSNTTNEMQRI